MLKVGLPVEAAKQKFRVDHPELDNSILDQSPDTMIDANAAPAAGGNAASAADMVALKDHPVYGKYVKMMKVGLPLEAVKTKLSMDHPNDDATGMAQSTQPQITVAITPAINT